MMMCCRVDVHRSFREACPFHFQSRNSSPRVGAAITSEMARWVCRHSNKRMGHAVAQLVEALRHKLDGCGFDSRWCHWNFSFFGPITALGFTQPLTEMSTRNISLGVKPVLRPMCIGPGRARNQVLFNQSKNTEPPIFYIAICNIFVWKFLWNILAGRPLQLDYLLPMKTGHFIPFSVGTYTIYTAPSSTTLKEQELKRLQLHPLYVNIRIITNRMLYFLSIYFNN